MNEVEGQGEELRRDSTGELVRLLSEQTSTLIRKEFELARAELTEKGKTAGAGAGMVGGAGVLGLLALGALTTFLIAVLAEAMPVWVAALLVTLVYAGGAALLALAGKQRVKRGMPPAPKQTVETVKEDVQWAKTQTRSARR